MIKGTTPKLQFKLPIDTSTIIAAEVMLQYVDNHKEITIVKKLDECEVGANTITATLTQEETLALPAPATALVQLRVMTNDGTVLATDVQKVFIKTLLKEGVI